MMSVKIYLFFLTMTVCNQMYCEAPESDKNTVVYATVHGKTVRPNDKNTVVYATVQGKTVRPKDPPEEKKDLYESGRISCFDALVLGSNSLKNCEVKSDTYCWEKARLMSYVAYQNDPGVVKRYIAYLKNFDKYTENILKKKSWCTLIATKCFERLRMAGFDNEVYPDFSISYKNTKEFNKEYAQTNFPTREQFGHFGYHDRCVTDYMIYIRDTKIENAIINVITHCESYCVNQLVSAGYINKEEKKNDEKKLTIYELNKTITPKAGSERDVCVVEFKNFLENSDIVDAVQPVYVLGQWCEHFCI